MFPGVFFTDHHEVGVVDRGRIHLEPHVAGVEAAPLFPGQGAQGQDQVHYHPVVSVAGPGQGVGETFHQLVLHQGLPLQEQVLLPAPG